MSPSFLDFWSASPSRSSSTPREVDPLASRPQRLASRRPEETLAVAASPSASDRGRLGIDRQAVDRGVAYAPIAAPLARFTKSVCRPASAHLGLPFSLGLRVESPLHQISFLIWSGLLLCGDGYHRSHLCKLLKTNCSAFLKKNGAGCVLHLSF